MRTGLMELVVAGLLTLAIAAVAFLLLRNRSTGVKIGVLAGIPMVALLFGFAWCAPFTRADLPGLAAHVQRAEAEHVASEERAAIATAELHARKAAEAERRRTEAKWLARNEALQIGAGKSRYVTYNVGPARALVIEAVEVMGKAIAIELRRDGEIVSLTRGEGRKILVETPPLEGVITLSILNQEADELADVRFSVSSKGL